MTTLPSMALLAAESAIHPGPVPDSLPAPLRVSPTFAIGADEFLLKLPSGLKFHYRQGRGVTVERPDAVAESDVPLFLNGTVYGAIAWINGLVPLHASGVAHGGKVHAFTGHSGAGKSTMAAALGNHDLPLLADDVLVLDLSDPTRIMCLPGHKQLKLWKDALALTGAEAQVAVRKDVDKFFITPPGGYQAGAMELTELYILTDHSKAEVTFTPYTGTERFTQARGAFYRPTLFNAVSGRQGLFGVVSRLASQLAITNFDRPRNRDLFAEGVATMAARIKGG